MNFKTRIDTQKIGELFRLTFDNQKWGEFHPRDLKPGLLTSPSPILGCCEARGLPSNVTPGKVCPCNKVLYINTCLDLCRLLKLSVNHVLMHKLMNVTVTKRNQLQRFCSHQPTLIGFNSVYL